MRDLLDRQLGRVTMYRLVTIALALLVVVMIAYTAVGTFTEPFTVKGQLLTLAVLLVASYVSNRLLGLAWRIRPHTESSVITALLLFFMFWPSTKLDDLVWLGTTAVLANATKYVLAWRGRHVLNPAAAGAVLAVVLQDLFGRDLSINATWWIGSEKLLPFVALGVFLVLWRTRRLAVGLLFVLIAGLLTVIGLLDSGGTFKAAVEAAAYSSPIVFMAGFMVTEPLTLPPRRWQQLVVGAVMGSLVAWPLFAPVLGIEPLTVGPLFVSPEVSLVVGNLVAFALARRRGVSLVLEKSRALTPETRELTFRAKRPLTFEPGQYAELTVPHAGVDGRGSRRSFSISSPPSPDGRLSFALRVPEKSSSFKKALLALEPGDTVHATGIGGDFIWPADRAVPLLLVAGGIGITPFLSQLRHESFRDAVVVYGVSSADEVPFVEELAGIRVVLVGPGRPSALPQSWTYVEASILSAELIADSVPDLADRRAYISGPPAMVNAVRPGLAKRCKRIKTDYFTGY
ncbi:FAD-dependent oxidoreductase [Aeromicrobium sp.]|uniref:FAD-dependent oxidoreductase n=1 Tax=Aeromicrobium sp. TaxID=1871063 RepID=UPI0030C3D984